VPKCLQLKAATPQQKSTATRRPSLPRRETATVLQAKKVHAIGPRREHRIHLPVSANRYNTIQRSLDLDLDDLPPLIDEDEMPEPQKVKIFDISGENMRQIAAAPIFSVRSSISSIPPRKPGIFPFIRKKADELNLNDELAHALEVGAPINLVNLVFDILSPTQLEKLPASNGKGFWDAIETASRMVARIGGFSHWLQIAKLQITWIPGFKMLLTDARTQAAEAKALKILSIARLPPKLEGKSYEEIIEILARMGFVQQEKYSASRNDLGPYGQDVWTSKDNLVIRIKVGGRSLIGKFVRPPHVVKEITETVHQYASKDIICKMTDDNILIPAGTKYSAKDMQAWYESVSGRKLAGTAWQDPENCGDRDFANLVHLWAEGAHTAIGAVPKM
jgi:hypothetical protein